MTLRAWGNTERFNSGFDMFSVSGASAQALIEGSNERLECEMDDRDDSVEVTLDAGTYVFTFLADTVDQYHHVDMVHHGSVSWTPA